MLKTRYRPPLETTDPPDGVGEILLTIPTSQGRRTDIETSSPDGGKVKLKSEVASEMGYTKDEASDYQQMAKLLRILANYHRFTPNYHTFTHGCLRMAVK